MGSTAAEKTEEELRKEIDELHRQQREITERLRDPRGLRRGGFPGAGPRNVAANGARQRGFVRPADRTENEDQPPAKRRLLSAVVKVEDGEIIEDAEAAKDVKMRDSLVEGDVVANQIDKKPSDWQQSGRSRRDFTKQAGKTEFEAPLVEPLPRELWRDSERRTCNCRDRMHLCGGQILYKELSKEREESEKLRQQEREQIAQKRKQDLTLRARIAAKAEEKKLELLFLHWTEHQRKLSNFIRTKTKPSIYYLPAKPLEKDATLIEQRKEQDFLEWKTVRRQELSEYQKQIGDQYIANVEKQLERKRWIKSWKPTGWSMDPRPEKSLGTGSNEDEDVEDINVGEDDLMDDVLDVDENHRRGDEISKAEADQTDTFIGVRSELFSGAVSCISM
ncbi:hypothetical protein NL676_039458 [Syzygium grande]|nr:hypothetical protein NL676_039458 [Syzygium grande]